MPLSFKAVLPLIPALYMGFRSSVVPCRVHEFGRLYPKREPAPLPLLFLFGRPNQQLVYVDVLRLGYSI